MFTNWRGDVDVMQLTLVDADIVIDARGKVTEAIDCLQDIGQRGWGYPDDQLPLSLWYLFGEVLACGC